MDTPTLPGDFPRARGRLRRDEPEAAACAEQVRRPAPGEKGGLAMASVSARPLLLQARVGRRAGWHMRTSRGQGEGRGPGARPRPPPPGVLAGGASRAKAAETLVAWGGFQVERDGPWVVLSLFGALWFGSFVVFHSTERARYLSLGAKVCALPQRTPSLLVERESCPEHSSHRGCP